MATGRISRMKHLGLKGVSLVPPIIAHPRLIPLAFRRVHFGEFLALDNAWIRAAGINTIIDIGANTGQFASAARAVLPHAVIYSFEPLAECCEELSRKFAAKQPFHVFNVALGAEAGVIALHRNAFTKSSSILEMTPLHRQAFPWTAESVQVSVELRTLDSFLPELILEPKVLVKIDVQGYEDRVLLGGEDVIRAATFVLVETSFHSLYQGEATFEMVYDIMRDYGFQYAGAHDQLRNPVDGRILQADALFTRGEDGG